MTPAHASFAKQFGAAGALADELPWWGWFDDRVLLTPSGSLLALAEWTAWPVEGRAAEQLDADARRWAKALGQLPHDCRLQLYALRRPCAVPEVPPGAEFPAVAWAWREREVARRGAELDVYLAWCLDARLASAGSGGGWRGWLRRGGSDDGFREEALRAAVARLRQVVGVQVSLLGGPEAALVLDWHAATALLAELANRPGVRAPGPAPGGGLARRLALSDIEAWPRRLEIGGEGVALHSLSEPPPEAWANMLRGLCDIDGAWTFHWEWRPLAASAARARIRSARRHYHQRRWSAYAHARDEQGTDLAMEDQGAALEARRMGEAMRELEAEGVAYGELACGLSLHGAEAELEGRSADVTGLVAELDAAALRETYGATAQWFARLPGQPRGRQLRTMLVSAPVAACLAPLWADAPGHDRCAHLDAAALATLETPSRRRYRWDLFQGSDVGHTLVLGATGSGKSFLLNFLLVSALRYAPRVCVLDLGGSYRALTEMVGGGYLSLDPAAPGAARARPFDLPPGERTLGFLAGWVRRLLALAGYACEGEDANEIRGRLEDAFGWPAGRRGLGAFAQTLPNRMRPAMSRWIGDGAWGRVFDPPPADGEDRELHPEWQVIDLSGAAQHADLAEAALGYYLERFRGEIEDRAELARLKVLVVDEAWRFLGDGGAAAYLGESAKTWRKHNAALVLASQSAADVLEARGGAQLLESLPNRVYLANPELSDTAAEALHLAPAEAAAVRALLPKQELYLKSAAGSARLSLRVSAAERWLYTSSPPEVARREAETRRRGSLRAALEALAGEGLS